MNKSANIFQPIINIFKRFNLIIFIVTIVGGLIFAVITLSSALQRTSTDSVGQSNTSNVFEQSTVTRLEKLKSSSENSVLPSLPSGRINPFAE